MTSDEQLWRVTQTTHLTDGSMSEVSSLGFILVYVDDLSSCVVSSTGSPASGSATPSPCWRKGKQVRFLGMEIHLGEDGACFEVSQKGFIEKLLRAHGHKGSKGPRDQLLLTPEEEAAPGPKKCG